MGLVTPAHYYLACGSHDPGPGGVKMSPSHVECADVDGDGRDEILIGGKGRGLFVCGWNVAGSFYSKERPFDPMSDVKIAEVVWFTRRDGVGGHPETYYVVSSDRPGHGGNGTAARWRWDAEAGLLRLEWKHGRRWLVY